LDVTRASPLRQGALPRPARRTLESTDEKARVMTTQEQELLLEALGAVIHDLQEARRKTRDQTLPTETRDFYKKVVTGFEMERERLRRALGVPET
jgi:hypothetical protein